jgi:hypothetical protein
MASTLSQRVLEIALSQQGVQEVPRGSNSGPQVNQYLKSVGLSSGNPWCMAFVYWCVDHAAAEFGIKNPLLKTGSVKNQWEKTSLRKIPVRATGIKPGSIFIMLFKNGTGHTGIIEKIENGIAYTVEGNTNEGGEREGFEWAKRERPISSFTGIIQLD